MTPHGLDRPICEWDGTGSGGAIKVVRVLRLLPRELVDASVDAVGE